jgi:hypothetical protein
MRSREKSYQTLDGLHNDHDSTPWYWKLIALAASWMILGGYLILPGLYDKHPDLKFSSASLSVFVVALMTAGYSFTVLLCFACKNPKFQAESVFLPAITSSAVGLLTIAYNFLSSKRYNWNTAAITGTVLSTTSTLLYGILLFWAHRRIVKIREGTVGSGKLWSEPHFYNNFIPNMYPTAVKRKQNAPSDLPLTEDDRITQQMALLLMKTDSGPSPDATSGTFRIDLPEDREQAERVANSSELVGTPPTQHADWNRGRAVSAGQSHLTEHSAYDRLDIRGRSAARPASIGAESTHSRAVSREERRREIERGT